MTARVNDPDGITNVVLRYRVDPSTSITALTMVDDGTGGDQLAGDKIFTATIFNDLNAWITVIIITIINIIHIIPTCMAAHLGPSHILLSSPHYPLT